MELVQTTDAGKVNDLGILPKPVPFGKYYLLEKVNTGGMAEVFKAKAFGEAGFERILAVKRILPSIAEDEEFISMFIDEAKIAGQLNHANIAQIFDLGKVDAHYFIALEYIPGRDLRAIFDRSVKLGEKLSVAQVCYVIMKLCEGLDYAHNKRDAQGHELGIVHRDISPQNVLISFEGECKLIDFGIAKAHGKSSSTQVGILKGKFSYMSPEQVRGGKIDRRSDVFALGIVLYEMLTLERLFLGSSDFSTLEKIRKVEFSPPTLFNPHIPQELEDIVLKALARDPSDRYQSAHEMQDGLQKFMFNQGLYYTNKDLASYCKSAFATEISLEQKKLEYYRTLKKDDLERANAQGSAKSADLASGDLSWDDDESATAVFQRDRPLSKEDVLAELDDIVLPDGDDIVYAKPKAKSPTPPKANGSGGPPKFEKYKAELPPPRSTAALMQPAEKSWDVGDVKPVDARPQQKKKSKLPLFIFLLIIIGLGGLIAWLMARPTIEYGTVRFDVDPGVAVTIEIDGEVVADGQLPPLTIEQIVAGENHEYRIAAAGYSENIGSFVVNGDELRPIPIKLTQDKPTSGGTGFNLTTTPGTAKVTIDGAPVDGTSPFMRSSLTAGAHEFVVSRIGYKTEKRTIDVPENTIVQLQVELKVAAVALTLQSEPEGANYIIKSLATSKEIKRGKTSDIIKGLPVGETYEIAVFQSGYEDFVKSWTPPANELNATELITLKRKEDRPMDVEADTRKATTRKPADAATRTRKIIVKRTDPPKDETRKEDTRKTETRKEDTRKADTRKADTRKDDGGGTTAKMAPGVLRINCKPPATVIINGKNYGMTPKKLDLPAGSYTVKLVNAEKGVNETKKVKVTSGEIRTIVHKQ